MKGSEVQPGEALRRAHVALLEDLRKPEEAVHPAPGKGVAELIARLGTTTTHITEHFRFEEQDGYMDAVREREPRLERAVGQLAAEHGELARGLAALVAQAGEVTRLDEPLRGKVREWVESLRRHEARENDLVQDAFGWDIGGED